MPNEPPSKRTGVLIVRVWIEMPGAVFKARLTRTSDIASPEQVVSAAGSAEEICQEVRDWLEEFQLRG